MKHAEIAVLDDAGTLAWSGSLYRFAKDNGMDREEVAALIGALVPPAGRWRSGAPPEPVSIGGGAAPVFYVSLVG